MCHNFKVGDFVKCIIPDGIIVKNDIYIVTRFREDSTHDIYVRPFGGNQEIPLSYMEARFELFCSPEQTEQTVTLQQNLLKDKANGIIDEMINYARETFCAEDLMDMNSIVCGDDYFCGMQKALNILGYDVDFETIFEIKSNMREL